jgi:hypothetical protein
MAELTKDIVESTFKQKVSDWITENKLLSVNDSLELVIDFFNNYSIRNVDSTIPDDDMLLFEYGIYDWQDGKGENFTIDITRQFYIEDEESDGRSQLHLIMYFDSEEFRGIEAANKWSVDFENIEEWKNQVINTQGFKAAENKQAKAFDIFLNETD